MRRDVCGKLVMSVLPHVLGGALAREAVSVSRLTRKYQATIPRPVRERLGVGAGDSIAFVLEADGVRVRRAEPFDREFARSVSDTLTEWLSPADEEAFRDL